VQREGDSPMIVDLAMILGGTVVFAVTSYLFWLLGQEDRLSSRWRNAPGIESFWVLVILGGWASGGALVARSIINLIAA
jgi:hypothetical protein